MSDERRMNIESFKAMVKDLEKEDFKGIFDTMGISDLMVLFQLVKNELIRRKENKEKENGQ